jgi:esterase/lipase superfamily enzyme
MNSYRSKSLREAWLIASLCLLALAMIGCASTPQLMPTPNLYAWGNFDPFDKVPAALQNNRAEVLYYTDRVPEGPPSDPKYGYKRSRSAAFGNAELQIGQDVSWAQLVKASRSKTRDVSLPLTVSDIHELGRFQPTPRHLIEIAQSTTQPSESDVQEAATEEAFKRELSSRLALTPSKEVYIFVHGFANNFYDSIITTGELWHFFGRKGVAIAYTWPAGSPTLRAYMYDRESSEFTVYHLKQMLKLVASCEDVEKINIIAHSRGTDVVVSALRELYLEMHGSGKDTRQELKLQSLVLAAPDLDFDVVIQRLATERLGRIPEQTAIYVCSKDEALGWADWLFSSVQRLGQLKSDQFSPAELEMMRHSGAAQFIDARVSDAGAFGHDYFRSNPAVSSDLILMMRYHIQPGAQYGRPLRASKNGFWVIDDDYPGPPRDLTTQRADR